MVTLNLTDSQYETVVQSLYNWADSLKQIASKEDAPFLRERFFESADSVIQTAHQIEAMVEAEHG